MSTSAIGTIRGHDRDRPNPAVPHPRSPAGAASLSAIATFRWRYRAASGTSRSRGGASRDFTGQGPAASSHGASLPAPHTATARGVSFTPTRSARTPHVASRVEPRPGEAGVARVSLPPRFASQRPSACASSVRPGLRCRGLVGIGPPRTPPREEGRLPLHPGCLPLPDRSPFGNLVRRSTGCPQSVEWQGGAFSTSDRSGPVTKAR